MAETLKTHMLTHSGAKTHTCSECIKKSFSHTATLKNHMTIHTGERRQKCAECRDSFGHAGDLKRHMLTQSGEKPHNANMLLHKQAILKSTWKETPYKSQIIANFAPTLLPQNHRYLNILHQCKECGNSFRKAGHLKNHTHIQTGEKPYNYPQCSFSSARSSNLKQHMIKHSKVLD